MREKPNFEILCATMNQEDFSLIQKMNVKSNIVFANQCKKTQFDEFQFDDKHCLKMISTETKGVGINRNLALMYSSASICLFADDDVTYFDDMESIVLDEFKKYKKADIIIFNFDSDSKIRTIKKYSRTHRVGSLSKKPWATFQIAFRRKEVIKKNLFFTTLFGGGCKYPCGEDTQWIKAAIRSGLNVYVSQKTIGNVSFQKSSWFSGYNESYYFGQGAAYQSHSRWTKTLWFLYIALRTKSESKLKFREMFFWMKKGAKCFCNTISYDEYITMQKKHY